MTDDLYGLVAVAETLIRINPQLTGAEALLKTLALYYALKNERVHLPAEEAA